MELFLNHFYSIKSPADFLSHVTLLRSSRTNFKKSSTANLSLTRHTMLFCVFFNVFCVIGKALMHILDALTFLAFEF